MTKAIIASIFWVLVISCHDNSVGPGAGDPFYPLAPGTSWKFLRQGGFMLPDSTYREFVERDSIINGRRWAVLVSVYGNDRIQRLYANSIVGYVSYSAVNNDSDLIYKYPTHINDTYFSQFEKIFVVDDNAKITTPAGTFDCIAYQQQYTFGDSAHLQKQYYNTYVARGYGKIKGELFSYDSLDVKQTVGTWQLIEYLIH